MSEQQKQLTRVKSKIGSIVLDFCKERLNDRPEFFASDLRSYVLMRAPNAPASPDRILRDLRQRGAINYRVVNRSKSLYELIQPGVSQTLPVLVPEDENEYMDGVGR